MFFVSIQWLVLNGRIVLNVLQNIFRTSWSAFGPRVGGDWGNIITVATVEVTAGTAGQRVCSSGGEGVVYEKALKKVFLRDLKV